MARIMILWGLVSMATLFVSDKTSFYVARVVLGAAEAGSSRDPPLPDLLDSSVGAGEEQRALHDRGADCDDCRCAGYRARSSRSTAVWVFRGGSGCSSVEGFPAVILGLLALWVFTDKPEQAAMVDGAGADLALADYGGRASGEECARSVIGVEESRERQGLALVLRLFPQRARDLRHLPVAPENPAGRIRLQGHQAEHHHRDPVHRRRSSGMVIIGAHSDRTGERKKHVAACAITAATGLVLAVTFRESVPLLVLSFALSQLGQRSVMSVFWAIPPMILGGRRRQPASR